VTAGVLHLARGKLVRAIDAGDGRYGGNAALRPLLGGGPSASGWARR
jgi:hypothetical protein